MLEYVIEIMEEGLNNLNYISMNLELEAKSL
jgi:hypothetical protein